MALDINKHDVTSDDALFARKRLPIGYQLRGYRLKAHANPAAEIDIGIFGAFPNGTGGCSVHAGDR